MDGAWTLLEPIPAAQTEALIIQAEIETPDSLPAECKAPEAVLIEIQSVPEQLSEESAAEPAAEPIETWTPERIEALTRLWEASFDELRVHRARRVAGSVEARPPCRDRPRVAQRRSESVAMGHCAWRGELGDPPDAGGSRGCSRSHAG